MTAATKVLVIGGYGVFGGRLIQLLEDEPRLNLLVAGRSAGHASAFVRSRGNTAAELTMALCPHSESYESAENDRFQFPRPDQSSADRTRSSNMRLARERLMRPRLRSMRRRVRQDTDHKHACHDEGDAKKREGIEALTEHPPGNERDQSDARPGPYGVGDGDRNGREHDCVRRAQIKIAKIKHAMTNIRIGAAASSSVLDQFF